MFPFQPKPERRTSFEDIFFEHYERLLEWALQLTRYDRPDAEDLVQELYIRFARLETTADHIESAENYLFSILRNLHYARMRRARTGVIDDLSIVDYDSVQRGLRAVDRTGLLFVRSDLHRVCDYLCSRKNESRSASIFILRYFLGYFPNEVMKVVQSTRVAVDKAIQAVRREARLDLKRPGAIRSIGSSRVQSTRTSNVPENDQNIFPALRAKIFASRTGECFERSVLESKYSQPGQSFTTEELAHLVSCATCLDRANKTLGIPLLEERSPDDTIGRDTPQGPDSSTGSTPTLISNRPSRKKNELERRRTQLKRRAEEVNQHRPQRLLIVVDGDVRASQKVTAAFNELRVELGRTEKPSFIEVLSEQGVCLAFALPEQPVPGNDLYQSQETALSDGRAIKIVMTFTEETPAIQVVYRDPLVAAEFEDDGVQVENSAVATRDAVLPTLAALEKPEALDWPERLWSWITDTPSLKMNPLLTSAMLFGLCSIVCFLLWTRSGPRISPQTFLNRAQLSDSSALASGHSGVIYQKVRISYSGHAMERAIYRDPEKKRKPRQQHLSAADQKLKDRLDLAGVNWDEPLSAANYAEWHDRQPAKQDVVTRTGNNLLTLTTSMETDSPVLRESLTVRASDFHPLERTIELRDQGTVEIAELNYDVMPWGAVNQDWFESPSGAMSGAAEIHPSLHLPHPLSDLELDEADLEVRVILNQLHADQGEQIHVDRSSAGIEVKGVVETDQRKRQLVSQLFQVPHVHTSILSVEELGKNPSPSSSRGSQPVLAYSVEAQQSPLERYLRERKLPLDRLATASQDLLSGCLRVQQAQTHLSELQRRFREDNQLPDDRRQQLTALSRNYANTIQAGLDLDRRTLLSLGFDAGDQSLPFGPGSPDDNLGEMVLRYQELCQELIASEPGQARSASVIAKELMASGALIRARINRTQTPPSVTHNNE